MAAQISIPAHIRERAGLIPGKIYKAGELVNLIDGTCDSAQVRMLVARGRAHQSGVTQVLE